MTRPSKNSLVLDGSEVKFRLEAERLQSKSAVHVDWVRFTTLLRNAPALPVDVLFPLPDPNVNVWDADFRTANHLKILRELPNCEFDASAQAFMLASDMVVALGSAFKVGSVVKKGHDFYKYRWPIERFDIECGWVGFLSSGDSPRQQAQAGTIHCNLFGAACTFADAGWRERIANIIDDCEGKLTRCDLALDFFDGFPGGIKRVVEDYENGLCNVSGKRLKCNQVGDWTQHSQGARSFYFGSKEAGKQTNVYEKGDQLFGVESGSKWLRAELRYGNKLRVLPVDMLRRPADFFAGASDWHRLVLAIADDSIRPEIVLCDKRLPIETVEAECARNLRWTLKTAAPSVAACLEYLGLDEVMAMFTNHKAPGRLQKFSPSELTRSFTAAFGRMTLPESSPAFVTA